MASEEKTLKRQQREKKELAKWQKEKARPKRKVYFWYLFLILTLVYIIDEAITYAPSQLQDGIITSFFTNAAETKDVWYSAGVKQMGLLSTLSIVLMIPSCFYKPLADRFGRKIFLFINTFGMALSMAICFLANNFFVYAIGFILMRWFVTPDEQVVYIFETAPKDKRATIYSIIKGTAEFGLFLIPWFRTMFMSGDDGAGWNYVFLVLACIGFAVALLVLLFARESDAFLNQRIAYLSLSEEEKQKLAQEKFSNKKKQGGLISGLVFAMKDKQLRWIFICTALFTLARCVPDSSTNIMKLYWNDSSDVTNLISKAQFIIPVGSAVLTLAYGLLSDKIGRKLISIIMLSLCTVCLLLFVFAAKYGWGVYTVGIFIGLYQAAYAGTGDIYIMMAGESAPTNLRASIMAAQSIFYGVGQLVSSLALSLIYTNAMDLGYFCLALAVPCFILSLSLLMLKVKETKGLAIEQIDQATTGQVDK